MRTSTVDRTLGTGSLRAWAGQIAWTDTTPMIEAPRIRLEVTFAQDLWR
jgi:hypothetical protein